MRKLISFTLLFTMVSCGKRKDDSSDSKKDVDLELIRLDVETDYIDNPSWVNVSWKFNADAVESTGWDGAIVITEGEQAAATCKPEDEPEGSISKSDMLPITVEDLKLNTTYAIIGCAFNADRNYYSQGITKTFKTSAAKTK